MPVLLAAAGFLLVGLDGSVNIAFPAMSAAFRVGPTTIRWVIICYVGTYALTAFAAGVLADRLGPGRVVRAGLVLSLFCFAAYALAPPLAVFLLLPLLPGGGGGGGFRGGAWGGFWVGGRCSSPACRSPPRSSSWPPGRARRVAIAAARGGWLRPPTFSAGPSSRPGSSPSLPTTPSSRSGSSGPDRKSV